MCVCVFGLMISGAAILINSVCARTDLFLGLGEALSPCLFGPNQLSVDNYFEITFHGQVWVGI